MGRGSCHHSVPPTTVNPHPVGPGSDLGPLSDKLPCSPRAQVRSSEEESPRPPSASVTALRVVAGQKLHPQNQTPFIDSHSDTLVAPAEMHRKRTDTCLLHMDKAERGRSSWPQETHPTCTGRKWSLGDNREAATGKQLLPMCVITFGHPGGSRWRPGVRCPHLPDDSPEAHAYESVWSPCSQTFSRETVLEKERASQQVRIPGCTAELQVRPTFFTRAVLGRALPPVAITMGWVG